MPVWQRHKIGGGKKNTLKKNLWRWILNAFLPWKDIHQELDKPTDFLDYNLDKLIRIKF